MQQNTRTDGAAAVTRGIATPMRLGVQASRPHTPGRYSPRLTEVWGRLPNHAGMCACSQERWGSQSSSLRQLHRQVAGIRPHSAKHTPMRFKLTHYHAVRYR